MTGKYGAMIDLLELDERVFPLATDDMHGAYGAFVAP